MDIDKLALGLKDNPAIAAAFAGASAGDTVTIKELTLIIDEIANDMVVGSVCCDELSEDDVTITPGPDDGDDETGTGESSEEASSPVLSVMAPGYGGKKK